MLLADTFVTLYSGSATAEPFLQGTVWTLYPANLENDIMQILENIPELVMEPFRNTEGEPVADRYQDLNTNVELHEILQQNGGQRLGLAPTCVPYFWTMAASDNLYVLNIRGIDALGSMATDYHVSFVVQNAFDCKKGLAAIGVHQDVDSVHIQENILGKGNTTLPVTRLVPAFLENEQELEKLNSIAWYEKLRGTQYLALSPGFDVDVERFNCELEKIRGSEDMKAVFGNWLRALDTYGEHFPVNLVPAKANTGRFSSENPPMHGIPWYFRPALFAPQGKQIISADVHQAQPRILYALSQDENFGKSFREHRDFYKHMTALFLNKRYDDMGDQERQQGKALTLPFLYGSGAKTLAQNLAQIRNESPNTPWAEMQLQQLEARFPVLTQWTGKLKQDAQYVVDLESEDYQGLRTPSGRVIRYEKKDLKNVRCYMAQGVEAEIMVDAILLFRERLKDKGLQDTCLLNFVHDELLVCTTAEEASKAGSLLKDCLEQAFREYLHTPDIMYNLIELSEPASCWGDLK